MIKKVKSRGKSLKRLNLIPKNNLLKQIRVEIRNCSTHGLPHVVDDTIHWLERMYWALGFAFTLVIVYILLSAQFTRFINTPTVVSIEMDYLEWNVSYPALTLCPILKVNSTDFNKLVKDLHNATGMYLETYVWAIGTISSLNLNALALTEPNNTNPIDPKDYAKTAARLFKRFDRSVLTSNFNYSISVQPAMTEMGMCHVINSNVAIFDDPIITSGKDIKYVKSNVDLSVFDSDFYTEIVNNDSVSFIYIHSSNEPMLSTFPSYTVDTGGFMTYKFQIWSSKISKELQSTPLQVRKCRFIDEPISSRYPFYSYNNCLLECRIRLTLTLCGCVPHVYKAMDEERVCKLSELKCFDKYKREIMALSVSNETLQIFKSARSLPKTPKDCACLSNCEMDIYRKDSEEFIDESSISRLRIALSAFPKIRVVRDILFSFSDIFLRSGGVINTCIGTSVISMMEFIFAFVRLAVLFLREKIIDTVTNITLLLECRIPWYK